LALSQRQINFQRAVAGFQAPGLTGEERAARMAEAKLEADYAQKQLNISKKQFTIGGQIFSVSAVRQVKDLQFALQDLQAGHRIQVNAAAAEQTISLLKAQMADQAALIGVQLSKEEAIFSAKINESAQIAATATGDAFGAIFKGVDKAWQAYGKGFAAWGTYWTTVAGGASGSGLTKTQQTQDKRERGASGLLGMTGGQTSLVVGEAGTETVAVLRNPRSFAMPAMSTTASGGGGTFIVQINNPVVKDESDIHKIVLAVEKAMQKRAALTLPRHR
jgi:hypothetical protein